MKSRYIFLVFVSLFMLSFGLSKGVKKKVEKEIKEVYQADHFNLQPKLFSEENTKDIPSAFTDTNFFEIKSNQELLGYAYVGSAPSKTDHFEYLLLFDSSLVIKKTKVLVYREDYGGEIGSKRWLKQFIGKSKDDQLVHGEDIVGISGATISVRSMTKSVNDVLRSIDILMKRKEL